MFLFLLCAEFRLGSKVIHGGLGSRRHHPWEFWPYYAVPTFRVNNGCRFYMGSLGLPQARTAGLRRRRQDIPQIHQ